MTTRQIVITFSIILFSFVLLQNSDPTHLELFLWNIEMPLFILMLTTMLLGAGAGWFFHMAYRKRKAAAKAVSAHPTSEPPRKPESIV